MEIHGLLQENELKCFINKTFGGSKWPLEKMGEVEELYAERQGVRKKTDKMSVLKEATYFPLFFNTVSSVSNFCTSN